MNTDKKFKKKQKNNKDQKNFDELSETFEI